MICTRIDQDAIKRELLDMHNPLNKFNKMSLKEQIKFLASKPIGFWICWDCITPDLLIFDESINYTKLRIKSRLKQEWFNIDRLKYLGDGKFEAYSKDYIFSFIPYYASKTFI